MIRHYSGKLKIKLFDTGSMYEMERRIAEFAEIRVVLDIQYHTGVFLPDTNKDQDVGEPWYSAMVVYVEPL